MRSVLLAPVRTGRALGRDGASENFKLEAVLMVLQINRYVLFSVF